MKDWQLQAAAQYLQREFPEDWQDTRVAQQYVRTFGQLTAAVIFVSDLSEDEARRYVDTRFSNCATPEHGA